MSKIDNEISSELRRGKETMVIWEIKNWNTTDELDFAVLKRKSNCLIDISSEPGLEGVQEPLKARVCFYFEEHMERKSERVNYDTHILEEHNWLRLRAKQLFNLDDRILQYEFKVNHEGDMLDNVSGGAFVKSREEFFDTGPIVLHNEFIHLQEKINPKGEKSISDITPTVFPRPATLRLRISVTPIFISAHSESESLQEAKTERETSLCEAMKNMFASEEIYPDIKLETTDNMTLSAHKFMLAARSHVLRNLIEKSVKEQNFDGFIKLTGVNAKPMVAILHWMYTGELHENIGKAMEEVVDAAITFELTGLIKILDRKVITITNKENMFQLYQVAQKNGMLIAAENISKFIKENI